LFNRDPKGSAGSSSAPLRVAAKLILLALLALPAGCNRQDAECLSRVGRKVAAHTRNSTGDVGAKFDLSWAGGKREPSLQEKIHERLRWENTLTDVALEVHVKDKEVELKGIVKTPQQRQRAIELAETLVGVDKVHDAMTLREPE
jgi:hypothetical protein